ncbi:uncharacterized protein LOC111388778 [Olea europaea var. sylvestris]|uniref:Pollen preferential protein n=1 Tax=Olea europaea subsp. europaea TaxID=158383 RepID=A0A8S0S4F1_OLEEU|nr:uncharacterized protein LOC111388778 [Olea europaea var. sylvestris]CAA2985994.1 Hypothetical predicted protein [Olea europaea subsp. europaea]
MAGKIAIESAVVAASLTRRQPLLITTPKTNGGSNRNDENGDGDGSHRGSRIGETAGECAAVCCCCPCAMMHLLVLAIYRLPKRLCKKAWREKKGKQLLKKKRKNSSLEEKENQRKIRTRSHMNMFGFDSDYDDEPTSDGRDYRNSEKNEAIDWDKEMWNRFDEAGFWRSASQRAEND